MVKHQKRDCVRGWLDIVALWVTNPMSLLAVEIFLLSVGIEPPSQKAGYPQDRCADDSATYPQVLDIPLHFVLNSSSVGSR